jgi:hydrogenase maturation protease
MSRIDGPLLVVGVGNILLRDEGVGVRVVERLRLSHEPLPADARLVDGGTLGLDLLPLIEEARGLVLVDAIDVQAAPGSVIVLRGRDVEDAFVGAVSSGQVGVGDLVAVCRLTEVLPDEIVLIGIQTAELEVGVDLSEPVAAALPEAASVVHAELRRMAAATSAIAAGPG